MHSHMKVFSEARLVMKGLALLIRNVQDHDVRFGDSSFRAR